MSKVPSFDSLRAKVIGRGPVFFKTAQAAPDAGAQMGQGMGGVTTGRPDEMQAPESADESRFEQDLSSMAYQFVVDRAPALLPYMLGFEVVDRSEDGSKAVGIYGYKIDDDFYYIPVFFINNQIRGVDMILNKRTNSFVPLTEDWINYIINKHSVTLGEPASKDVTSTLEQPDLNFLQAPSNRKTASAEDTMWSLKTAWAIMKEQSEKMASSDPLVKSMFNGVLRAVKGAPIKKEAEAKYINGFMRTVGGPEAQISLLKTFKNIKFANAALTFYENMTAFDEDNVKDAFIHKQAMAKKAAALPKLKVVTAEDITVKVEDNTSTSEEDAKQILSRGFTITDSRPDEDKADISDDVVIVDFEKRYSSPTEVGKYSFVMSDGKLRDGYLLSLTHSPDECDRDETTIVYFPDEKVVAMAPVSALVVDSGTEAKSHGDDYAKLFAQAKPYDEVEPSTDYSNGKAYIFVGPDGQAFTPVQIRAVFKDGDNVTYKYDNSTYRHCVKTSAKSNGVDFGNWDLSDRFHDSNGYKTNDKGPHYGHGICECSISADMLKFCKGITRPSATSKGLIVPDTWKVLEATCIDPSTGYDYSKTTEEERARIRAADEQKRLEYKEKYTFGSLSCIIASLHEEGSARMKLASVGPNEFHIHVDGFRQTPRITYKEAALTLVSHFGTSPSATFRMLDKAAAEGSVRVTVSPRKRLQKSAQGVGVSMPAPVQQEASMDPYTGIPVYGDPYTDQQTGQFTGVPSLPTEGGLTRGIADGSEIQKGMQGPEDQTIPIDQQAQELAAQAAQAGQKHVFDQAAVGGLSKVYDTSAVVDSYIPNFMDSLDRLGRVMFLFYWKHDDFNARYGSDDVVEMEDRLRGVFKQLGDLTLKLKEKAVRVD